jgi:hypothetical protein
MKNKLMLVMLLGMIMIGLASAIDCGSNDIGIFKQGEMINLRQTCDTCTYVNLSSVTIPPNSTMLYFNEAMTKTGIEYNYSFINTSINGNYFYTVIGDKDGIDQSETFCFSVTPSGFVGSNVLSFAIWFLFLISIILFIAFLFVNAKPPVKWTFFLISMMFLLQTVSILFTSLQDAVINPKIVGYFDFLASASFILFWFAMGLLAVLWILTTLQTLLLKNKQTKEAKYQ